MSKNLQICKKAKTAACVRSSPCPHGGDHATTSSRAVCSSRVVRIIRRGLYPGRDSRSSLASTLRVAILTAFAAWTPPRVLRARAARRSSEKGSTLADRRRTQIAAVAAAAARAKAERESRVAAARHAASASGDVPFVSAEPAETNAEKSDGVKNGVADASAASAKSANTKPAASATTRELSRASSFTGVFERMRRHFY